MDAKAKNEKEMEGEGGTDEIPQEGVDSADYGNDDQADATAAEFDTDED